MSSHFEVSGNANLLLEVLRVEKGEKKLIAMMDGLSAIDLARQLLQAMSQHPDQTLREHALRQLHPSSWQILGASNGDVHVAYKLPIGLDMAMGVPSSTVHDMVRALESPPMSPQ